MSDEMPSKNRRPVWIALILIAVVAVGLSFGPGRNLGQRFLQSLRVQKVQTVNVDLSSFVGPNANRSLQQMFSQMISDKVTVTVNENEQDASDVAAASQIAKFQVKLIGARKDAPHLTVSGEHAFNLTVDRARLQAIFNEAGRPDLALPQSIDGASVAVRLPRTVRAQYGSCPGPPSATANVATPTPSSTQYSDCIILNEGSSPEVSIPAGLDLAQLAQIGLELAGMSPNQAHDFLQTVNWKTILGLPVPRSMRSYEAVEVGGVQATLMNTAGRREPTYTLIWVKNGMAYSLTVTFMFGTWFSTLTNGVIVLGLHGLAFMGGWLEQMSGFTESARLVTLGIVSSLIMPSEAIWRRAAFEMETPLAGSLQFSPFADVSIPSWTMIGYAGLYLLVALTIAIARFHQRDL